MTAEPKWWRFTGIAGFKRYMPNHIIQRAKGNGLGWTRWYEPARKDDPVHRLEYEVMRYRKALDAIANWPAMKDSPDLRLARGYARASNAEIPIEWINGADEQRAGQP